MEFHNEKVNREIEQKLLFGKYDTDQTRNHITYCTVDYHVVLDWTKSVLHVPRNFIQVSRLIS